jgi:S1-C subfamily serine protease
MRSARWGQRGRGRWRLGASAALLVVAAWVGAGCAADTQGEVGAASPDALNPDALSADALNPDAVGTPAPEGGLVTRTQPAIYGEDNRLEAYEAAAASPQMAATARRTGVALVSHGNVVLGSDGDIRVEGPQLGPLYQLCESERFRDQPSAARCSGVLIDDDLVLTAGHCVSDARECGSRRFVFDFLYDAPGVLAPLSVDDLYHCRQVVARKEVLAEDWAVVQLDRPVPADRAPAVVAREATALTIGAQVALVGFGSGLPMKVDLNGRVTAPRGEALDYFKATIDAFGGHSGGGVFDLNQRVVGVLSAGAQDYITSGTCQVAARYLEEGDGVGEVVTYAYHAIEGLCETGWPSERLCGRSPRCGDGFCTGTEDPATCSQDCAPYASAPWAWSCNATFYGAGDDCDCGCGAPDPDCQDLTLRIYGCDSGQVCDANGACSDARRPAPQTWRCDATAFDSAGTQAICDCGCGGYDPDCNDPSRPVTGCAEGMICDVTGACAPASGTHPDTWRCNPAFYGTGDDCDCGCGAPDPDCQIPSLPIYGCEFGEQCTEQGVCARPEGVPSEWTCDPLYYGAKDDCDCGCGAPDPDCQDPSLSVLGCRIGEVCDGAGACALAPPPAPDDCQCASLHRRPHSPETGRGLLLACAALFASALGALRRRASVRCRAAD